jgi:hypothetical protein
MYQLLKCIKYFGEYRSSHLKRSSRIIYGLPGGDNELEASQSQTYSEFVEAMFHDMLHRSKHLAWPKPKIKEYLSKDPILQKSDAGNYHFIQHFKF